MLNSDELQELYEGLKLNSVNKYDYVLTGECPGSWVPRSRGGWTWGGTPTLGPASFEEGRAVLPRIRWRPSNGRALLA